MRLVSHVEIEPLIGSYSRSHPHTLLPTTLAIAEPFLIGSAFYAFVRPALPEQWSTDDGYMRLCVAKGTLVPAMKLRLGQSQASVVHNPTSI